MVKPAGHCPHLGLKQNRAIRFDSATPEHRCYVHGEAQAIPVEQADYCLSDNHVNCPLYTGFGIGSISGPGAAMTDDMMSPPPGERSGWLARLSLRDRLIYAVLIVVLLSIIGIYVVVGLQMFQHSSVAGDGSPVPIAARSATPTEPTDANTPTEPAGPTEPTESDTPTPTESDTPTPTESTTATPDPTSSAGPASTPSIGSTQVSAPATSTPASTPTRLPDTGGPTAAPQPTTPPAPVISQETLTLYFADASGTLLMPQQRVASVESKQVAAAAMRELIAGPQGGLQRSVPADMQVRSLEVQGDTLVVDLSRDPGSEQARTAIALTLTEFPNIPAGRLLVNGTPAGAPMARPVLNADNPQGLSTAYSSGNRFLPLYFVGSSGYVRITRIVPRTSEVARATVNELLAGPGSYSNHLSNPIPPGTTLLDIARGDNRTVVVDLSAAFASATSREAAIDVLVLSLTELRDPGGATYFDHVEVRIEGGSLADHWGSAFAGPFAR